VLALLCDGVTWLLCVDVLLWRQNGWEMRALISRRCLMQSEMVHVSFNLITYHVPIV